jgi:hypothetical protein
VSAVRNGTLTFTVTHPPTHGTLSGTPPHLVSTSDAGFAGIDSFTYAANRRGDELPVTAPSSSPGELYPAFRT